MEGDNKKEETVLPPGFRFHPSDEELVTYYLVNKISDANFTARAVADVDLNKCEPWDLPEKAKMGELEWYFFNLRVRKYPTGVRTNRATNSGYWKTTGKDKEIFNNLTSELVGMKKILVFYKGRAPRGEKTNWIIHEYRIDSKSTFTTTKDEWVVCRVFQKSGGAKKLPTRSQSRAVNNPYNLDTGQMIQPDNFQFPMGRINADQRAEFARIFQGDFSTSVNNLPLAGGFTISGLNLNIGGATTQPMPPPHAMNQQDVTSMLSIGYTAEIDQAYRAGGSRYTSMELDNYWPPY